MRPTLIAVVGAAVSIVLSGCGSLRGEVSMVGDDGATYRVNEVQAGEASLDDLDGLVSEVDSLSSARSALPTVEISSSAVVPAVFQFTASLVDGGMVDGASLFDGTPQLLTFVQTTCPISDDERPNLAEAALRHPDVRFVVIHSGGSHADYVESIAASGLNAPNVINIDDSDLTIWNRFGVTASPSNVLVDHAGLLRSSQGALGDSGLDRAAAAVSNGW